MSQEENLEKVAKNFSRILNKKSQKLYFTKLKNQVIQEFKAAKCGKEGKICLKMYLNKQTSSNLLT